MNVAAIDVNAELFDTCSMYSSVALTPLRSPALILNSGVRSETVTFEIGESGVGGAEHDVGNAQ